jgi:hypothetical protein
MPDMQQFSNVRAASGNVNVPRHKIEGQLVDGETVLNDFTGPNAIFWPDVLAALSADQQDAIASIVAVHLVDMRAGLETGP